MSQQQKKLAAIIALLCGVIALAYFGYQALTRRYSPQESLQSISSSQSPESTPDRTDSSEPDGQSLQPERVAAPNFTITDQSGNMVTLESLKGKPVVINFWATWCPYCVEEMPDFDKAYTTYSEEVTFVMLNVTDGVRETRAKAQAHYEEKGYSFPIYFDDQDMQATNTYQVSSFPTTYFIDRNGNFVAYAVGMLDAESLEKGIKMALEQDAVESEIKNTTWCTMEPVYSKMDAENAKKMMEEFGDGSKGSYILLDVRTEAEYLEKRIPDSVLIPDYELAQRAEAELPDKTQVILVYCRSGNRSATAAKELVAMGYNHVYDIGGIIDWPYETTSGQ